MHADFSIIHSSVEK